MRVGQVCSREVVVVGRSESVREAAWIMREHHVGSVVVVEGRGEQRKPVGIVTDRDIVVEVIAADLDLDGIAVGDLSTLELVTVREDEELLTAIKVMRDHGVRRIPVVNDRAHLIGILAVDDVLDIVAESLMDLVSLVARGQRRERQRVV